MTFDEAKREMLEIAGDEYHSLVYSQIISKKKVYETECVVYINGPGRFVGGSWRQVLDKLRLVMSPTILPTGDETPGEDVPVPIPPPVLESPIPEPVPPDQKMGAE